VRPVQSTNSYTNKSILKGNKKDYLEFGSSTVILIFEHGRTYFLDDLLKNIASGMETYVLMGEEAATILKQWQIT
jgi:phosphatidylserine decarboxylase